MYNLKLPFIIHGPQIYICDQPSTFPSLLASDTSEKSFHKPSKPVVGTGEAFYYMYQGVSILNMYYDPDTQGERIKISQ